MSRTELLDRDRPCCTSPHLSHECDGSCFAEAPTHPTQEHMTELWGRIEDMTERLKDEPENRTLAIMLNATLDNYNAKQKLINKQ